MPPDPQTDVAVQEVVGSFFPSWAGQAAVEGRNGKFELRACVPPSTPNTHSFVLEYSAERATPILLRSRPRRKATEQEATEQEATEQEATEQEATEQEATEQESTEQGYSILYRQESSTTNWQSANTYIRGGNSSDTLGETLSNPTTKSDQS